MTYNERQTFVCQQCGRADTCGYVTRNLVCKCEYNSAVMQGWELGQQDMKEQMMKDAIATPLYLDGDFLALDLDFSKMGYKVGDNVKIIIIKQNELWPKRSIP